MTIIDIIDETTVNSCNESTVTLCPQNSVSSLSLNQSVRDDTIDESHLYWLIFLTLATEHVFALISMFGIVANVTNSLIFFRHGLKDRVTLCLFSLAVADQFFLVTFSYHNFMTIMAESPPFGVGEEAWRTTICYGFGFHLAVRTTVGLYIMVIAVDRCLCVTFPLRAASLISTRTMAVILVLFALLPQLAFICQPLKYVVSKTEIGGIPHWKIVPSQLYLANIKVMDIITYAILDISVPACTFIVVSLSTLMTVKQLTAAAAWRRKTSSTSIEHNSQQVALTKMLVLASCVYVVTMIPFMSHRATRMIVDGFSVFGVYRRFYNITSRFCYGFPVLNSSATFFIYYKHSSRYRKELSKMSFCSRCMS